MEPTTISSPNIWDIVENFKRRCRIKGWETCKYEDLISAKGKYHYFVWTRRIYADTFKKVSANSHQHIKEGDSYKKVNVAYVAWISQELVSENIVESLFKSNSFLGRVALYDISPIYRNEPTCLKINETDSSVFREFEKFLKESGISCKTVLKTKQVAH